MSLNNNILINTVENDIQHNNIKTSNIETNNNEDNLCNICGDQLINNITKLSCGHIFHYSCIEMAYKYSKKLECPYCRQYGGKLKKPCELCKAILKSGKNKGKQCNNKIKLGDYCGKHLNYEK
tara:strand:- start:1087 stop:1455 length:369 start_codon:yes stop_codon:yes gene_type:complete